MEAPVPVHYPEEKSRKSTAYAGNVLDIALAVSAWWLADRFLDPASTFDYHPHIPAIGYALVIAQAFFLPLLLLNRRVSLTGYEQLPKKLNEKALFPVHDGMAMYSLVLSFGCSFVLPILFYVPFRKESGMPAFGWFIALPILTAALATVISMSTEATKRVARVFGRGPLRWLLLAVGVCYVELLQVVILLVGLTPLNYGDIGGSGLLTLMGFFLGYVPARFMLFYATGRRNLDFNIALASVLIVAWKLLAQY